MKTLRSLSVGVLLATLGTAACSTDPAVAKKKFLADGNRYFAEGHYSEASLEYRKAIQQDPLFAEAHSKLAETYDKLGDAIAATREYVKAADLRPDDATLQTRAGTFLLMAGAFDDARGRALKALKQNPQFMDAHILLAQSTAHMKDLDAAVRHIEDAIRMEPTDARAVVNLATMEQAKGDIRNAEAQFKRATALDPKSVPAALALGRFYLSTGRPKEAEESLKNAIALAPTDLTANRALAGVYLTTNRFKEAEAPLKAAAEGASSAQKLILADYYLVALRNDEAKKALQALMDRQDVFADTRLRLSMLEWRQGHRQEAYSLVDEVLKKGATDSRANLMKARYLVADRKFEAARDLLKTSVNADPRRSTAHYLLGTTYRALGDLESAKKEFAESLRLAPSQIESKMQLAQLSLLSGELDGAESLARAAVQTEPRNGEARLVLVDVLIARKNFPEAIRDATALAGISPTLPQPHMQLGRIHYKQTDYASAERSFRRAIDLSNGSVEAVGALVETLIAAGKIQQARLLAEERVARNPKESASLLIAAEVYKAAHEVGKAETALKNALALDPANMNAYMELSRMFFAEQRLDEARAQLENIVAKQPKAVWAHTFIGLSLHLQNRKAEARQRYEQVLQIDPRAAVAANNLAVILLDEGQNLDRALELAQTAKQQLPDNADISDTLGWAYSRKGLGSLAIAPLEFSVRKDPDNPLFRYHLGEAYAQAGQTGKARQILEQVLASTAQFEGRDDAIKTLARLTTRQ
jgi:Tfp pilus assembly protein PilF